jgi:hypothetical protein
VTKLLAGEPQVKEPAVIGEELNAEPAENDLEVGGREADLSGTHDGSPLPAESLEVVRGAGDCLAVTLQPPAAGNST